MKLFLETLCIICFSVFFVTTAHCEVVDRIIAIVNDDIVTLRELENFVTVKKKNQFTSIDEYLRNIQLKDKLDVYINGVLIKQQAKKLRIEVSEKEVANIIENIKKQNLITEIELKEQLKKENITYEDFSEGIKLNVLRNRVLTRVLSPEVNVTDAILKAYYNQHKDTYVEVEYRLKQIFISSQRRDASQRATEAYKLLTEGRSFEDMAAEFSDDPSAKQGGDIGFAKSEDLLPALKDSVKLLIPNTYTNVVQSPYGFHILKLLEIKKSELLPFEKVKDRIHEQIVLQESEKRSNEYINQLRQSSYIEVKI